MYFDTMLNGIPHDEVGGGVMGLDLDDPRLLLREDVLNDPDRSTARCGARRPSGGS